MKAIYNKKEGRPGTLLIAVLLLLTACNPSGKRDTVADTSSDSLQETPLQEASTVVYEDTIPCADCPGIIMSIRFNTTGLSYEQSMTYLEGTPDGRDTTFTESGQYTTEKGFGDDENAILYVLDYNEPDKGQAFLARGDSALVMLDGNRELITSGLNYTLRRKE